LPGVKLGEQIPGAILRKAEMRASGAAISAAEVRNVMSGLREAFVSASLLASLRKH